MTPRWKIALILLAIVAVSGVAGGLAGYRLGWHTARKRSQPESWNASAMRTLDRRLKFTPEQRTRVQSILEGGVTELNHIRAQTLMRTDQTLQRAVTEIDRELTPEQRTEFEKLTKAHLRPSLELLNVRPARKQ